MPIGCPTPEVIPEFSNEPSPVATLPDDTTVVPSGEPTPTDSQAPDESLFTPTPEPTEVPSPPIEEFGPE